MVNNPWFIYFLPPHSFRSKGNERNRGPSHRCDTHVPGVLCDLPRVVATRNSPVPEQETLTSRQNAVSSEGNFSPLINWNDGCVMLGFSVLKFNPGVPTTVGVGFFSKNLIGFTRRPQVIIIYSAVPVPAAAGGQ